MKTTKPKSRTYQLGAAHERQAVLAKVRRERKHEERIGRASSAVWHALNNIETWLHGRTARFDKAEGGLGKRKAAR